MGLPRLISVIYLDLSIGELSDAPTDADKESKDLVCIKRGQQLLFLIPKLTY